MPSASEIFRHKSSVTLCSPRSIRPHGPSFRNATTGMLEVADMGGLDIWLAAEGNLFGALCNSDKASESLRSQVAQGRLGIKNGKGFYEYSDEQKAKAQREFYKRLLIQLRASKNY